VAGPLLLDSSVIHDIIAKATELSQGVLFNLDTWKTSGYRPTPTIIEAAQALYEKHDVHEISRSDAGAKNLHSTTSRIANVIEESKRDGRKSICFVTGVPGAGKTLRERVIGGYLPRDKVQYRSVLGNSNLDEACDIGEKKIGQLLSNTRMKFSKGCQRLYKNLSLRRSKSRPVGVVCCQICRRR
ncbi:MAG: hypothetical protein ACR2O8_17950, partial [Rhizobiaceae bacterium]